MSGAVLKLLKDREDRKKEFKCEFDVERVRTLANAAHLLKDFPTSVSSALIASITAELTAINLKQAEAMSKEMEKQTSEMQEAMASDAKVVEAPSARPSPAPASGLGRM
jgi:hypothetical protein